MKKVLLILIMVLLLLIPTVRGSLISMLIGLIFIGSLFSIHKLKKLDWLLIVLLGLGLFVLYSLSLLWSENTELGLSNLETKLSLFIIPIALNLIGPFNKQERGKLWFSFLIGLAVSMVYHLGTSALQWLETSNNSEFFYVGLAKDFHPSYLAMYFCAGLSVLLFGLKEFELKRWQNVMKNIALCVFSGFVVLLFSKTGFICLIGILAMQLVKIFSQKSYREFPILPLVFLTMGLAFYSADGKNNRVKAAISSNSNNTQVQTKAYRNSTQSRVIFWRTSLDILSNHPAGVGIGDAQEVLITDFEKQGETYLVQKNFNSHNQYLTTALALGVPGIATLVFLFLLLGIRAINQKDWLLAGIAAVIALNFMTESMLERADGAIFIPLILSLILFKRN